MAGAPYGGPFDLTPASPSLTACFEQNVYPPLWEPDGDGIPVDQPMDPSRWDLFDLNRHTAAPLDGDDWYGLQGGFAVQAAGPWVPRQTYHYGPVLWLAAAQPYAAVPALPGPPATGLRTVDYKATLAVPADVTPGASVTWAPGRSS